MTLTLHDDYAVFNKTLEAVRKYTPTKLRQLHNYLHGSLNYFSQKSNNCMLFITKPSQLIQLTDTVNPNLIAFCHSPETHNSFGLMSDHYAILNIPSLPSNQLLPPQQQLTQTLKRLTFLIKHSQPGFFTKDPPSPGLPTSLYPQM